MPNQDDGVTGRDGYIIATALALAVAAIPHLPKEYQAWSDRDDMIKLLRAQQPDQAETLLAMAAETMAHVEERYRAG